MTTNNRRTTGKKPKSEKTRVLMFAKRMVDELGYDFQMPSRELAKHFKNIHPATLKRYFKALENDGYLNWKRHAGKYDARVILNRDKVTELLTLLN